MKNDTRVALIQTSRYGCPAWELNERGECGDVLLYWPGHTPSAASLDEAINCLKEDYQIIVYDAEFTLACYCLEWTSQQGIGYNFKKVSGPGQGAWAEAYKLVCDG